MKSENHNEQPPVAEIDFRLDDDRLSEMHISMCYWGSTVKISIDELISACAELIRLRARVPAQHGQTTEHIGYVTRDRRMMMFKDSPNMLPEDTRDLDKLVVLTGEMPAADRDLLAENLRLKASLSIATLRLANLQPALPEQGSQPPRSLSVITHASGKSVAAVKMEALEAFAIEQEIQADLFSLHGPGCNGQQEALHAARAARSYASSLRDSQHG